MCIGCVRKVSLKKYMDYRVTSKKRENEENSNRFCVFLGIIQ